MSFNYAATAATATRLLERFGAAATLKRQTAGAYDTATGIAAVTVTSVATTAAVFDYAAKYIDGTLILSGDKQAYLSPAVLPKQGDILTWQSVDYTIINAKAVSPAGTPVLYECQIRG